MKLERFIDSNDVTYTTRLVDKCVIKEAEDKIGIKFGKQLREYILKYGYLSYEFAELYGINSNQNLDSDMVKQTVYLHKYFPETESLIAIENQGEGDYFLVDKDDNIFEYDSDLKELIDLKKKLFDYIFDRFEEIKTI